MKPVRYNSYFDKGRIIMGALDRKKLKKTFGYYKAADVESYLDAAEEAVSDWNGQKSKLTQELEETRREVESVKNEAAHIAAELEKSKDSVRLLSERSGELDLLQKQYETLSSRNEQLEDRNRELMQKLGEQLDEVRNLSWKLEDSRIELESVRTELGIANSQTAILGDRVARQQKELEERERLLQMDPVGEANERAEMIVQNAMKVSQQMLDDAENVRTRAFAAVRSAYFNTMDFRREIEGKFIQLEHDLDRSVGALRTIDVQDPEPDYAPNFVPNYVPEEVS